MSRRTGDSFGPSDPDDDVFDALPAHQRRPVPELGADIEMEDDEDSRPNAPQSRSGHSNLSPAHDSSRSPAKTIGRAFAGSRYAGLGQSTPVRDPTRSVTEPGVALPSPSHNPDLKRVSPGKPSSSEKRIRRSFSPSKTPPRHLDGSDYSEPLLGAWGNMNRTDYDIDRPKRSNKQRMSEARERKAKAKESKEANLRKYGQEHARLAGLKRTANVEGELESCRQQMEDLKAKNETLEKEKAELKREKAEMQEKSVGADGRLRELEAERVANQGMIMFPRADFQELVNRGWTAAQDRDHAQSVARGATEALEMVRDTLVVRGVRIPPEILEILDQIEQSDDGEADWEGIEDDEVDGGEDDVA